MKYALPLAAVAAFMLAACEPTATEDAAAPEAPAAEDAATDAGAEAGEAVLALDGEGLRVVDAGSGSTRLIAFGMPYDETIMALHPVIGDPTGSSSAPECPPGPLEVIEFGDALTLYFQDQTFAGWWTDEAGYSTMNGIQPGMTRADLEDSGSEIELTETSLGQEFDAGGVYGIMNEDASAVDLLWAGANCFAR